MPERLTPARRQALAVLAHGETTGSTVWYSNHTTPARDLGGGRRRLAVHHQPADWLETNGYIEGCDGHRTGRLKLTDAGRTLAKEAANG